MDSDDLTTDTKPGATLEWTLAVISAATTSTLLAWWAPRSWIRALTIHQGHGLNVARGTTVGNLSAASALLGKGWKVHPHSCRRAPWLTN